MPDRTLSPEELAALVDELDRVMEEASRLRREVTRQLEEQRDGQQQTITPLGSRRRKKKKKKKS